MSVETSSLEMQTAFLENEIKLAQYYTGLRDKIGALNVAFIGFVMSIFKTASENEAVFFVILIFIGVFSFVSCLRAGIAYNFHFNNYENLLKQRSDLSDILANNRKVYKDHTMPTGWVCFGETKIPTLNYWAILIGSICPFLAFAAFSPCT